LIIVFSKPPVPGEAKTRLIPRLGAWGAARLQLRLTRRALAVARAARCGPVELHLSRRHSLFKRVRLQRGRDLGARMARAFADARRPAILIGADCPVLEPADLRRAWRHLRGGYDAVVAPAEDGGYALIGLRRPLPELFRDIEWGSGRVYAETASRLVRYRWRALRTLWDVDRPSDLERLRSLRFPSARRRGAPRSADNLAHSGGSGRR
jgi:rSAM/selenodomain-associated transferase 1